MDSGAEDDGRETENGHSTATRHTTMSGRDDGREADQGAVYTVRHQPLEAEVQVDEEDISGLCKKGRKEVKKLNA